MWRTLIDRMCASLNRRLKNVVLSVCRLIRIMSSEYNCLAEEPHHEHVYCVDNLVKHEFLKIIDGVEREACTNPTNSPTVDPTAAPTEAPSAEPTAKPTMKIWQEIPWYPIKWDSSSSSSSSSPCKKGCDSDSSSSSYSFSFSSFSSSSSSSSSRPCGKDSDSSSSSVPCQQSHIPKGYVFERNDRSSSERDEEHHSKTWRR